MVKNEKITIVNKKGEILGYKNTNDFNYAKDFHKVCLIIPKAAKNKIILSKRAKNKQPWSDTWVCAIGGKVNEGENQKEAALREMKEESNFSSELLEKGSFIYDKDNYKAIFYIFTTKDEISIRDLKPDKKETQYFKEFSIGEIKEKINKNQNKFAETFIQAFNLLIKNK